MQVKYEITDEKAYKKALEKLAKKFYKNDAKLKIIKVADTLLLLAHGLLFGLFLRTFLKWQDFFIDYYESDMPIYFGVAFFILTVAIIFYGLVIRPLLSWKMVYEMTIKPVLMERSIIELQDNGLHDKREDCLEVWGYNYITNVTYIDDFFAIVLKHAKVILIPLTAFTDKSACELFEKALKAKIQYENLSN